MSTATRYAQLMAHYTKHGLNAQQADVMARSIILSESKRGLSGGWTAFHITMTVFWILIGLVLAPFTCFLSLVFCFYPLIWAFHSSIATK